MSWLYVRVRKWRSLGLLLLVGGVFGYALFGPSALFAQSGLPPKITNIKITQPTGTSTTISWETDIMADSEVNYGLDKNYGIVRDPFPNKIQHSVTIPDLEPSTMYHLRIGSQDAVGNQALTGDYTVTTKGVMSQKELEKIPVEDRTYVEKAIASIKFLKSIEGLVAVEGAVKEQAEKVLGKPEIIGNPKRIEDIGADYVVISWGTNQDANSIVHYARESEFKSGGSYTTEAGDRDEKVQDHKVRVEGLVSGTTYHFAVESETELGIKVESDDDSFTTKAAMPTVSGFRVMKVQANSATLSWRTSIPASGEVEYTDTKSKVAQTVGSPVFATSHTVTLSNLRLGARYSAIVKAKNAVGDEVKSNILYFTTVKDVAPPLISKVSNESTLYPSADAKVQTIASWGTDEAAFCQFFYRSGLNPNEAPNGLGEEKEARTDHVAVIVEFLPSTVYQFWIECRDPSNNKSKSENFVLFTPNKEKSIIDIIMENFSGTFGWVKNIGK